VDALGIPRDDADYENASLKDPVFVLYEDDSLVTAMDVRTERLLAPTADAKNQVHLVIEVDVRVSHPRPFNAPLTGDCGQALPVGDFGVFAGVPVSRAAAATKLLTAALAAEEPQRRARK
jgi:hypothetical protein